MSEHTPTPWAVEEVRTSIGRCFKIGSPEMLSEASKKPTYLCVYDDHGVGDNIQKANAAFIVKAVNSHDQLVDALESFVGMFGAQQIPGTIGDEVLQKANAALASVTEST